jgi:phosphopantothenoylcysteine decarboxylase / phosphopantothenate---cysteine ligase
MRFTGKKLILGICGSIAAYKVLDAIRALQQQGADTLWPVLTPSASQFVPALSLQMLTGQPVYANELALTSTTQQAAHIVLAQQAHGMLIMPATANSLAKLAHGQADNMLTTTALTLHQTPIIIAPAMNPRMWDHPATQANLRTLSQWPHIRLIPPTEGLMACGEVGVGHLPPLPLVLDHVYAALHPHRNKLQGQTIVVTAGGTITPIDTVRHLTNRSTGKMGLALADEAWAMGANVILVSATPVENKPYTVHVAPTVPSMAAVLHACVPQAHQLWMAAALSDFMLATPIEGKLKRTAVGATLTLASAQDVLAGLAEHKRPHQQFIGFAAEHGALVAEAKAKCHRKGIDAIVLNDISRVDIGFASDDNEVYLIKARNDNTADTGPLFLPRQPKAAIAQALLLAMATCKPLAEPIVNNGQGQGQQSDFSAYGQALAPLAP